MKRIVPALAVVAILLRGPAASACSCVAAPTKDLYHKATLVFVGTAMTVRTEDHTSRADFVVEDLYKGRSSDHAAVHTESQGGACGIAFLPGQRYTVFARSAPDQTITTSICDGTTDDTHVLSAAGYLRPAQRFGSGGESVPVAAHGSGARVAAIVVAGLLLLTAGGSVWLIKRARTSKGPG